MELWKNGKHFLTTYWITIVVVPTQHLALYMIFLKKMINNFFVMEILGFVTDVLTIFVCISIFYMLTKGKPYNKR